MTASRDFVGAEMWIDNNATLTRQNLSNGDIKLVLRSRKYPSLSREGYITPPEEPNDFSDLVLSLVADLKSAGG